MQLSTVTLCFGKLYLIFNFSKNPVKKITGVTMCILLHIKGKCIVLLCWILRCFVVGEVVCVQGGFREYTFIKTFHLKPRSENSWNSTKLWFSLFPESHICKSSNHCYVRQLGRLTFKLLKKVGLLNDAFLNNILLF